MRKHWLRLLLGLLLGGGALWLATRQVDWAASLQALRRADMGLLLLALAAQSGTYLLGANRWRCLFPEPASLSRRTLTAALLVAHLINTLLPFQPGPLVRAYLVGREEGQSRVLVLTTVGVEKLLEAMALVIGLALLFLWLPLPAWVRRAGLGAAALALGGLAIVGLLHRGRRRLERWLLGLSQAISGVGLAMLEGASGWLKPARIVPLLLWTVALWLSGVAVNLLVLRALDLPVQPLIGVTLFILLMLGIRLPAGPASLGIFESLCVVGLGWFGVEPTAALSYGLALHAVVLLPGLAGGAWVLGRDAALRVGLRQAA